MPFLNVRHASIYYEVWGSGEPQARWYTAFNGLGLDVTAFKGFWDGDLGPGRRLLIFDPRGAGQTIHAGDFTAADLAEDVVCLWNALGVEQTVCIGICIGSNLSLWVAATLPHRVSRLHVVSASPGPTWYAPGFESWSADLEHTVRRSELILSPGFQRTRPDVVANYPGQIFRRIEAGAFLGATERLRRVAHSVPLGEILARVHVPTYVLHGAEDALIAPAAARFLAAQIPNARLDILAGAGHCLYGPPELNRDAMREFVLRPEAAPPGAMPWTMAGQ